MVMKPVFYAMASLRDVLLAALKSLFRGRSFIQALLTFWTTTATTQDTQNDGSSKNVTISVGQFLAEAERLLLGPINARGLHELSQKLKAQFRHGLLSNPACMLPSYNSQLPTGSEPGQFLALDVGGSTLRVALIDLGARGSPGCETGILRIDTFKIDNAIRGLVGRAFFDWMAEKIRQTVPEDSEKGHSSEHPLLVGLAWSFPIAQTSSKGGNLCGMGKGFLAADGLLGEDLGEIIKLACQKKGLHVELSAIVNDSSATLLSEAYTTPSTRFGLILGTGVNIAVHLPVHTIGQSKYGDRPDSWHEKASHVIVNTELGMFGTDILPLTKWDKLLKKAHPRPDFQPLEHLVSGYYLGEVCRLILIDAIHTTGIFGGTVPLSLQTSYSLDTETLSLLEADETPTLTTAVHTFQTRHPSTTLPTSSDVSFLRTIASYVSKRSASIVAASLFALWQLKAETEAEFLAPLSLGSPFVAETETELKISASKTTVAYNGSVIENYPGYRATLQNFLDELISGNDDGAESDTKGSIALVEAKESSLLGAAVALACVD